MKTILLIEDNLEILENLKEFLELEGFKTLATNNGKKGVSLAMEFIPDLIICDVLMPEMNGHTVLKKLLSKPETAEIPFIFSSALSESIDVEDALNNGADDYLNKPFELEQLLNIVRSRLISGSKRQKVVIEN